MARKVISQKLRHPEKAKNIPFKIKKKPDWIRVRASYSKSYIKIRELTRQYRLNTVCEEAACPNIGECWGKRHATFMILGDICTRACAFCNVATGKPQKIDKNEPKRVAQSVAKLGMRHVVITSVDRDDLKDGGATQFADCIKFLRKYAPRVTIEVLTPDFRGKNNALNTVIAAKPDVFNHNLETVPKLYRKIRPGANYIHSLNLLKEAKEINPEIFTKSGIMVGLGESKNEVLQVMNDMRSVNVDFITIGQYLAPTRRHAPVDRFVTPEEFKEYRAIANSKGFLLVAATPLTRSSYHADEDFARLKKQRNYEISSSI